MQLFVAMQQFAYVAIAMAALAAKSQLCANLLWPTIFGWVALIHCCGKLI